MINVMNAMKKRVKKIYVRVVILDIIYQKGFNILGQNVKSVMKDVLIVSLKIIQIQAFVIIVIGTIVGIMENV